MTGNPARGYFESYQHLRMSRDAEGVLLVEMHTNGGALRFDAIDHEQFVDAFYQIGRDRENKVVILTGSSDWMTEIDLASFGNAADPNVWARVHDEQVQLLENLANIRVPLIAAVEGRAHLHSEYALLASTIVAAEGATFGDVAHCAAGLVPGDGIHTLWSYRAGPGRAEAFLLGPTPISAATAAEWGVVAHVVPNGTAVQKAREIAATYLRLPELTRRYTRMCFMQPLKERIVHEVGYGLAMEGASVAALMQAMSAAVSGGR